MKSIKIRNAILSDIPNMLVSAEKFFNLSNYSRITYFDSNSIRFLITRLISDYLSICLVAELNEEYIGGAGASLYPLYFNKLHLTGCELFFWVDEEHRNSRAGFILFKTLEKEAIKKGADSFCMSSLESSNPVEMNKLYTRYGYALSEHFYYKKLSNVVNI